MGSHSLGYDSARYRNVTVLAGILAVAALIRMLGLFQHATMPDEAFTFYISSRPYLAMLDLLKTSDFHPPLIYALGHALFHLSKLAYTFRLVAVAFGVAGVAATYSLAQRIAPRSHVMIALLMAIAPIVVFYDRFFRMYALLWSLCVITWAILLWALDNPRRTLPWVCYALGASALLYTQYIAFFTVAAQIMFVAMEHRKARGFWIAMGAAIVSFVPWLPVFFVQYPLGGTAYNGMQGGISKFLVLPAVMVIDGLPPAIEFHPFITALLWLLVIGGFCLAVVKRRRLAIWLTVPILLQFAYSLISGKLLVGQRYLLQAVPVLLMLIFIAFEWLRETRARAFAMPLAVGLALTMAAGTVDKLFLPQYMQIDWSQYRQFLDSKVRPGDVAVFDGSMVYFVLIGSKAATGRSLFLISNRKNAIDMSRAASKFARVWYVDYESSLADPGHVAYTTLLRTHSRHTSWRTTEAGYGDAVLTTIFERPPGRRAPYKTIRTTSSANTRR